MAESLFEVSFRPTRQRDHSSVAARRLTARRCGTCLSSPRCRDLASAEHGTGLAMAIIGRLIEAEIRGGIRRFLLHVLRTAS